MYPFLSKPPPPPQKQRPCHPPPPTPVVPRKRSSTFSAIAAWAAHVQPGSPAPSRRLSVSSHRSPSPCPASFFVFDTPTPDHNQFPVALTGLGYTSVFVNLPTTPPMNKPSIPTVVDSAGPMKRFRSLTLLRPRSTRPTPTTQPLSPKSPTATKIPDPHTDTTEILAATIVKRKKAAYAYAKSKPAPQKVKSDLPPSLAAELALMQFADGGSTEDNIKRIMESRARAAAPAGTKPSVAAATAVGDVYRDGKGGVWLDREEELEYVHLLAGHDASRVVGPEKWVSFGGEVKDGKEDEAEELALATLAGGRRGSANSIASDMSSLDPCNVVKPADEDDARMVRVPLLHTSTNQQPKRTGAEPVLTIPSRPRRGQHHLRPSPNFFLLDLNAFIVPSTPRTPRTPHTPSSPYPSTHRTPLRNRSSSLTSAFPQCHTITNKRPRGPARRRAAPPPLNIVAHLPMRGVSPDLDDDEGVEKARREFVDGSFDPPSQSPRVGAEMTKRPAMPVVQRVPRLAELVEGENTIRKKRSRALLSLFGRK